MGTGQHKFEFKALEDNRRRGQRRALKQVEDGKRGASDLWN